ncbi:MAG: hypothetical protein C5B51_02965 [Terriglobia bacterium]|nr:MAG: hypothetical protein C5B51_02965 [Terriglobia bacterium]
MTTANGVRLLAVGLAAALSVCAQLPLEPFHDSGQGVTAAYEGWFQNADGTYNILFGYYNRNQKQELDIPIGPNNRIEPGGPDRGQPTHFLPGRQWGLFTITVPKDFGKNKLTWTLVANGQTAAIPAGLDPLWELAPFKDAGDDTPPTVRFEGAPPVQGPRPVTVSLSAKMTEPLPLTVRVSDDAKVIPGMQRPRTPPVTLRWSKFRGPGTVTFANARPPADKVDDPATGAAFNGQATTTATFSEPGEYILYLVANDWTGPGGRGFQCCWTNALVKVSVK